jgi:hypothetical protein
MERSVSQSIILHYLYLFFVFFSFSFVYSFRSSLLLFLFSFPTGLVSLPPSFYFSAKLIAHLLQESIAADPLLCTAARGLPYLFQKSLSSNYR